MDPILFVLTDDPDEFDGLAARTDLGEVIATGDAGEVRRRAEERASTLVLVDSRACGGRGEEVARDLAAEGLAVVLALHAPSLAATTAALAAGVRDVTGLPPEPERLTPHLSGADAPGPELIPLAESEDRENLVGRSPGLLHAFRTLARLAPSGANVVLEGEPGTGRRTAARFLHDGSAPPDAPFVELSCASLPEPLLESELFGHEAGTFPWAIARRRGRLERAGEGTLFLDDVDQLPVRLQVRLVQALREGGVERVGGSESVPVSARVVAASVRPLADRVAAGAFLPDLHDLLGVVTVTLPPLRERREDLLPLATHFAALAARRHGRAAAYLSAEAARKMETHDWPGNVRELRSVMEHAVLVCDGEVVRADHLPDSVRWPGGAGRGDVAPEEVQARASLDEVEAAHIRRVLRSTGGNLSQAADVLGIHRNTLRRKLRKYGIPS